MPTPRVSHSCRSAASRSGSICTMRPLLLTCAVALLLGACEFGAHARLDDFGRVTRADSTAFCIVPEGQLKDNGEPPRLCGDGGSPSTEGVAVGDCVHLSVEDPDGVVEDIQPSNRCAAE
jgi:hypothetical protein